MNVAERHNKYRRTSASAARQWLPMPCKQSCTTAAAAMSCAAANNICKCGRKARVHGPGKGGRTDHPEETRSHDSGQAQQGQRHSSSSTEANEQQCGRWVLPGDAGMQPLQLRRHIIQQVLQRQRNPQQVVVLAPERRNSVGVAAHQLHATAELYSLGR